MRRFATAMCVVGGVSLAIGAAIFAEYLGHALSAATGMPSMGWAAGVLTAVGAVLTVWGEMLRSRTRDPDPTPRSQGGRGGDVVFVRSRGTATAGDGGDAGPPGRGGAGGTVTMIDSDGSATGGRGGRGGLPGSFGGDGGGGEVTGQPFGRIHAAGGDGGDAARLGRPALGAQSPLAEHGPDWALNLPGSRDQYGIPLPGRGGDSYQAYVDLDGHTYDMNAMLKLLQMRNRSIIDDVDEAAARDNIRAYEHQKWLRWAMALYPEDVRDVLRHMYQVDDSQGDDAKHD